jgi:6-pyruvoyltetrahydropterin/6-carboxytetrahydropterin synthase
MFEIDIKREFSAAHFLKGYKGNCASLHGHNWIVEAYILADSLDEIGIAVDFRVLKKELEAIISKLDHSCLNDLSCFESQNPTSEVIAKYIYNELTTIFNSAGRKVNKVRVCESPGSGATYFE